MNTLPWPLAFSILMGIAVLSTGAYLYWDKEPENAQAIIGRVLSPIWGCIKLLYKIIRWLVTLLIAYVVLIALTIPYLAMALIWVTFKKVAGEHASVHVKLS